MWRTLLHSRWNRWLDVIHFVDGTRVTLLQSHTLLTHCYNMKCYCAWYDTSCLTGWPFLNGGFLFVPILTFLVCGDDETFQLEQRPWSTLFCTTASNALICDLIGYMSNTCSCSKRLKGMKMQRRDNIKKGWQDRSKVWTNHCHHIHAIIIQYSCLFTYLFI